MSNKANQKAPELKCKPISPQKLKHVTQRKKSRRAETVLPAIQLPAVTLGRSNESGICSPQARDMALPTLLGVMTRPMQSDPPVHTRPSRPTGAAPQAAAGSLAMLPRRCGAANGSTSNGPRQGIPGRVLRTSSGG